MECVTAQDNSRLKSDKNKNLFSRDKKWRCNFGPYIY
ncbi:MAG: hypothetical protein RUMPE_01336 [Eubacteriales bacterium SKADARSKE-1]|nr:hypothetical protein [Eubacteriales bacterium SKADARSKE-1]